MTYPVSDLKQAYNACNPDIPLPVNDVRYVDLTAVRGEDQNLVNMSAMAIDLASSEVQSSGYHRQLVSGHRGCGKSTELLRLQAKLMEQKFFTVYFDVGSLLNLGNVDYIDILLLIASEVVEQLSQKNISLNTQLLEDLYLWFADKVIAQDSKKEVLARVETEGSIGVEIPLLSKLLMRLSGGIRNSEEERTEVRNTLRKEWYIFVEKLNTLLDQARTKVREQQYRDLVVIVDGLEKMFYEVYRDGNGTLIGESTHSLLFIKQAEQLTVPRCHLIYTFPISLAFSDNLAAAFGVDSPMIMPMVNIKKPEGVTELLELVKKRVVIEQVFESTTLVERIITMSGGAVRDLMRLIRLSCLNALTAPTPQSQMTSAAVEPAIRSLMREFDRLIQEKDLSILQKVEKTQERIVGEEHFMRLLHNRVIHEYQNGKSWFSLHPIVREIPEIRKKITSNDPC